MHSTAVCCYRARAARGRRAQAIVRRSLALQRIQQPEIQAPRQSGSVRQMANTIQQLQQQVAELQANQSQVWKALDF